jgi:hypothetical protein
MRQFTTKHCLLLLLLVLFSTFTAWSQNLTGIWRGYFITEDFNQYKFELQVKQTSSSITGVSYSYLNTVFYGKAVLTGSYNKSGNTALIREIKTTELRMSGMSSACIMRCIFEYSKSGKEEFLEGTFTSKFETDGYGHKKGDDCGGGKVFLRKVPTSDFYVEPFLRKSATPLPPVKKDTQSRKVDPPVVTRKPPVTKSKTPVTRPPVTKKKTDPIVTAPRTDTTTKITEQPVARHTPVINVPTPNVLKTRTNELVKTLVVRDEQVIVKLYDNGEIDDDTISVYLDKKLILSNKRLTASALVIKLKLDEDNPDHELVMVAENLGRIPPNTSLMIVESGEQRFDVRITSTEQKNAVVRFRYEKPK